MDDNNFDRLVKEKLDGYEDPSFDESALADFQDKIAAVYTTPWYQQSFTYLATALIAVFTAIIIFLYTPGNVENNSLAVISLANKNQRTIDSLENVIKTLTNERAASFTQKPKAEQSDQASDNAEDIKQKSSISTKRKRSNLVALGPVDQLPFELYQALIRKGMLVDDNGSGYLVAPDQERVAYNTTNAPTRIRDVYHSPTFGVNPIPADEKSEIASTTIKKDNEISAETKDAIEKHYSKGVGIYIGPHADVTFGQFSKGKALPTPRVGFLAEVVLSQRFSIEGGIDYSTTSIDFNRDFYTIDIPNLDESLGTVNSAHIKNSLLSTPLSLKYRKWISDKNQAFIKVGYTPYFSILQEYQCGYKPNYSHYPSQPYGNDVTSILQVERSFAYGNTSTISLGLTRLMKKNDKIEASFFYESSLSAVGREKLAMSLFGIRTAYWFNLR